MTATLTRGTLGRLAAHARTADLVASVNTAFSAGDWAGFSGTGTATPTVSADATPGELIATLNAGSGRRGLRYTAVEPGEDCFVVAQRRTQTTGGAPGVVVRNKGATPADDGILVTLPAGFSGTFTINEVQAAASLQSSSSGTANRGVSDITRHAAWSRGTDADSFQESAFGTGVSNASLNLTGLDADTDGTFAGIYFGSSAANASRWQSFALMSSAILRVEGPDTVAWVVRLRDAGGTLIYTSGAQSGGVVEINALTLLTTLFAGAIPLMSQIEVYDPGAASVLAGPETPAERLWGGDVWTYADTPGVPDEPTATAVGAEDLTVEWDAVATADTYKLRRATSPGGPYTLLTETASLSYNDTGLTPLTDYYYTVEACNEAGCSAASPALEVTTLDVVPAVPTAPTVGSALSTSLTVSWAAVPFATLYDVYRSATLGGVYTLRGFTASTSYVDTGLDPETEYFYKVSACSGVGCSDLSAAASGTTTEEGLSIPCAMILDVYEEDGETIAWQVSTDPAFPTPYLLFPSNYGAREIDPVNGAASIGTVDVTIADVPTTPGDQDSGWVTARLATIFGRRARLRRFVTQALGYYVIADGPAGAPRLSESYAGYTFGIRDTRETERRLKAFTNGGRTSIVPVGPIGDWGATDDGPLLAGVTPLVGTTLITPGTAPGESLCAVLFTDLLDFATDFPALRYDASLEITEAGAEALRGVVDGARAYFPDADILWRLAGSSDPFNVSRPSVPAAYGERIGGVAAGTNDATEIAGECLTSVTLWAAASAPAGMPATDGVSVEIILRHRGRTSEDLPFYYEGNMGALLAALYDRDLERAPDTGGALYDPEGLDDLPDGMIGGGVRYDAAAVAAITIPVLLRATEAIDDGRDWAERALYGPSGWIPSVDAAGRISPVSRDRPAVVTGPLIDDEVSEPSPDWDAGQRVVTGVRFTYQRYFIPGELANVAVEADGLAIREVVREFRDKPAEDRHGEQRVEFDASAFGAIGTTGGLFDVGGLQRPGIPEVPEALAAAARYEVLERYRDGAPAFRLAVRRASVPGIRDGLYCPVDLSWLPDFDTGRRGLTEAAAQVLAVENADCEWVTLLLEISKVIALPGFYDAGEVTSDLPEGS